MSIYPKTRLHFIIPSIGALSVLGILATLASIPGESRAKNIKNTEQSARNLTYTLAEQVARPYDIRKNDAVRLKFDVQEVFLGIDKVVPCGLTVNDC